jgi:putative hydrolase of the HAD superfamily
MKHNTNNPIKNIVFDLGGVILNIDFNKTAAAFTALGVKNFDQYFSQVYADPLFKKLETEKTAGAFYDRVRSAASITASNEEIDTAWNALLQDFPEKRIKKLQQLSTQYRLFLFSNTNVIHHIAFQKKFRDQYGFDMDSLFEKAWYSHLAGYRKPDVAAFEYIIKDGGLLAAETLFIDDTLPNIESAIKAGLQAAHLEPKKDMVELMEELLVISR